MRIYRNKVYANKSNKVCKKYYDFGRNIFFYQKMGLQPFHRTFWPDKWDSVRGIVGLILMRVSIIFLWVRVSFISTIYSIDRQTIQIQICPIIRLEVSKVLYVAGKVEDDSKGGPTSIQGYSTEYPLFLAKYFVYILYSMYISKKTKISPIT